MRYPQNFYMATEEASFSDQQLPINGSFQLRRHTLCRGLLVASGDQGTTFFTPFSFFFPIQTFSLPTTFCFVPEMNLDQSREDPSTEISRHIKHTLDANSSGSASLPLYPPSYTFSIPSSALSRHRDTLHASSTDGVLHSQHRRQPSTTC